MRATSCEQTERKNFHQTEYIIDRNFHRAQPKPSILINVHKPFTGFYVCVISFMFRFPLYMGFLQGYKTVRPSDM